MKSTFLLSLGFAFLLAGCAGAPKTSVSSYRSDFGAGIDFIVDNELDSGDKPTELIWLNASRIHDGPWNSKYYLEVRYEALPQTGWLDIVPGETLVLTIDGQTVKYDGIGSLNDRREGGSKTLVEHAVYEATADDIRRIAKAKDIKVDIIGSSRTIHREFKPANIEKFRTFVLTYMGF